MLWIRLRFLVGFQVSVVNTLCRAQKTCIKLTLPIELEARTRPRREEQVEEFSRTGTSGSGGHVIVQLLAHDGEHPAVARLVSPPGPL